MHAIEITNSGYAAMLVFGNIVMAADEFHEIGRSALTKRQIIYQVGVILCLFGLNVLDLNQKLSCIEGSWKTADLTGSELFG